MKLSRENKLTNNAYQKLIKNQIEGNAKAFWLKYVERYGLPEGVPINPNEVYKDSGWISWVNWLGWDKINKKQD